MLKTLDENITRYQQCLEFQSIILIYFIHRKHTIATIHFSNEIVYNLPARLTIVPVLGLLTEDTRLDLFPGRDPALKCSGSIQSPP